MAITKLGGPDNIVNPVFNPLVYYYDSDNKTEEAFRYIVEIKDTTTNNTIFEKTIIPDITDKKCILNLNRELQDFISYNLDFDNLDGLNYVADDSFYRFNIEVGEEYIEEWYWNDFGFAGSSNWPNWGDPQINPNSLARTMLYTISNTNQPPYQNGDTIFVEANIPSGEPTLAYTGVHKVLDVYNQNGTGGAYWVVVLDLPWVNVSGTSGGGSVKYADFRKTRFTNLYSDNDQRVINTVLSKKDYLNYNISDYNMVVGNTNVNLLSNLYSGMTIREDNILFIQYLINGSSLNQVRSITFTNDNGDVSELNLNTNSNISIYGLDVGPTRTNWGTFSLGTGPIVKPTTKWYEFTLLDVSDNPISKTYRLNIDRSCDISQSTMEFLFMDKFGSFLPYNFTARNVEKQNIRRDSYTKRLGGYNSVDTKFDYDLKDGGKEVYSSDYSRSFDLSTDYMRDTESIFFQNVLHSPVTYLKVDGEYTRCVINTNSLTVKKDNWSERIRYEMSVTLSHRENINI